MDPTLVSLASVALGGVIGITGTIATTAMQGAREERRHRRELAAQFALAEWKHAHEAIKDMGGAAGSLDLHLIRMTKILQLIETGELTSEKLIELNAESRQLFEALRAAEQE
ncbi:hypothetical protein NGM99_12570 [Mesorhizobium sp. RP14(2022)]|uniref:Uncharacterized protein n=1 Tax=Mesorhizobium liriopis TaxID=2953882 RepID=A0ABT1C782_9HYPH|nr:hypothetical protein [Mesorhizobium liriopis]MCO6050617.1 hypothetical protein [Mesorhizobium liriopis]